MLPVEAICAGRKIVLPRLAFNVHVMQLALTIAKAAFDKDEIPIGAIVFREVKMTEDCVQIEILGAAHNQRELDSDPTAHAEIVAMRQAGAFLNNWHLNDCTLCVTLEPCPMCAGAMVNARMKKLIFGASDQKMGCIETIYQLGSEPKFNHRLEEIEGGVLHGESVALLQRFFPTKTQETRAK